jgi:vacuolar-type H+-ATPase subunit H
MSGLEPIKMIVDAEKQAAEMLEKAQAKASQIRKGLDTRIRGEREETLKSAKKEADAIVERAESDGKLEAGTYEKEAVPRIKEVVAKASARKGRAVDKLVSIVLEGNA